MVILHIAGCVNRLSAGYKKACQRQADILAESGNGILSLVQLPPVTASGFFLMPFTQVIDDSTEIQILIL